MQQTVGHLETAALPHGVHTSPPAAANHGSAPRAYKNLILPEYLVLLTAILQFVDSSSLPRPQTHTDCTQGTQASSPQTSLGRQIAQPWTVTLPSPLHNVHPPHFCCCALLCFPFCRQLGQKPAPLWLGVGAVLFGMDLITEQLHKGIFLNSKKRKIYQNCMLLTCGFAMAHTDQQCTSIRMQGKSTCPVTLTDLGTLSTCANDRPHHAVFLCDASPS